MNVSKPVVVACAAYLLASGCNRIEYLPPAQNGSGTELTIVKRGLSADSHGFRFLGILPLAFPSITDAERKILEQAAIPPHDPNYVLVNKVKQTNTVYLFIASVHSLKLTADVAEIRRIQAPDARR